MNDLTRVAVCSGLFPPSTWNGANQWSSRPASPHITSILNPSDSNRRCLCRSIKPVRLSELLLRNKFEQFSDGKVSPFLITL